MKGYPTWFSSAHLNAWILAAASTGAIMAPGFLEMRLDFFIGWRLPSTYRAAVFLAHVGAGLILTLFLAALWAVHMRMYYRRGKGLLSGGLSACFLLLLAFTGLGIQYATEGKLLTFISSSHVAAGLVFLITYAVHFGLRRGRSN